MRARLAPAAAAALAAAAVWSLLGGARAGEGADPVPGAAQEALDRLAKGPPKPAADVLRIHFLAVGQGDATIIEGPRLPDGDRRVLVYDVGETSGGGNEGQHVVEPYLRSQLDDGPRHRPVVFLDYLIPSHYHRDHMGWYDEDSASGIYYLYEASGVKVGKVLDSGLDYDAAGTGDKLYRKWVETYRVPRETLAFDQRSEKRQIDLGPDVWIEVLSVGAEVEGRGRVLKDRHVNTTSQNDFSIAMILHYRRFDFYIAGDLSGYLHESWGAWYHNMEAASAHQLRDVEVYKVNHHGSRWSSSYPFLQRIRPEVGVISCGKGHKHPNPATVERLLGWEDFWSGRPRGTDLYQTQACDGYLAPGPHEVTGKKQVVSDGSIVLETDGETGFTLWLPGAAEGIRYEIDPVAAYTDLSWQALKLRERVAAGEPPFGGKADFDLQLAPVMGVDDVERGIVTAPRLQDGAPGAD
ncbi:hypothetical protein L6R50_16920 [Myxococcota bacterium]|nr:hypothetical protein [Myxococcota bacterium]